MGYIVLDSQYESLQCIAKDINELNIKRFNVSYLQSKNQLIEISNEDFISLQTDEKQFSSYKNQTLTLKNDLPLIYRNTKTGYDQYIAGVIERIDLISSEYENTNFASELNLYKNLLKNLDTSSISYPTVTVERYLLNQGYSILGQLQLI